MRSYPTRFIYLTLAAILVTGALLVSRQSPFSKDKEKTDATVSKKITFRTERLREAPKSLPVRLGKIPEIALIPRPPLDAQKTARIKSCIADLAKIDSPDYGLSPTMSGVAFLPIAGQRQANTMVLTNHQLKSSDALRTLVEMGPESLPFLLDALDDKTPTQLVVKHPGDFGGMFYQRELWGNPVNPVEAKVLDLPRKQIEVYRADEPIQSYTLKVGDICLVAIGQIVGRRYQAVRYQPTACIIINSPTVDVQLCKQVRAIWSSEDSVKRLFDSLLLDYATEGNWEKGESFDRWSVGSDLQVAAVLRLLYYFPKETTPLMARRLQRLRIEKTNSDNGAADANKDLEAWEHREVANGARTEELVKAVAWCKEPAIRDAVRSIFQRTGDVAILLAALPGIDQVDAELIRTRIEFFLRQVPKDEGAPYGDGYKLLLAAHQRLRDAAKPLFVQYLKDAGSMRCYSVCEVLRSTNEDWSIELLGLLLTDKRVIGGYRHPASAGATANTLPIRVCDAAAETLSAHCPELRFTMKGTERELDRQIKGIRVQLDRIRQ